MRAGARRLRSVRQAGSEERQGYVSTQSFSWREKVLHFLDRDLWNAEATARKGIAWARRGLQFLVLVAQGFSRDQLLLRASALTYYSVLSLIPLLAIALSVVKAVGVSENIAAIIVDKVAAGSPEAGQRILEIVQQVDFAGLGTLGAAVLFLTTVLGISSIEGSLNTIWGVKRERPWERRLPDYLAVLVIAPILLGVALSLGTTLQSQALVRRLLQISLFETLYTVGLRQLPMIFLCVGFAFLYWFLPNTKVRLSSALVGGAVAAALFTLAQRAYVGFNVGVGRYNVLFGGFAMLPLLLVWIYFSWVIVLLGAEVAFAYQNLAGVRRARRGDQPGPAAREAIGLAIAAWVARAFREGEGATTAETLAEALDVSVRSVRGILADLEGAGIISARGDPERDGFQLGRAAEGISVSEVLEALRGSRGPSTRLASVGAPVGELLAETDERTAEALRGRTLADLVGSAPNVDLPSEEPW
jgi:membrane protein